MFDSFHHTSSVNSPSPSRIPWQLFFCNGSPSSSNMQRWALQPNRNPSHFEWCLRMIEWTITEKLSGVLKVCCFTSLQFVTQITLDIQAGNPFFLCSNTKPFESHPHHGLHQQAPHFWCCQHSISPLNPGCYANWEEGIKEGNTIWWTSQKSIILQWVGSVLFTLESSTLPSPGYFMWNPWKGGWTAEIPDGFHGMVGGIHGMGDGFHGFSRWIPYGMSSWNHNYIHILYYF